MENKAQNIEHDFDSSERTFKREKPEYESGDYYFSGTFYFTRNVNDKISKKEIKSIYLEIKRLVELYGGQDYLQVYINSKNEKLFLIDQLSEEMIASGQFAPAYNHCTLMFDYEY